MSGPNFYYAHEGYEGGTADSTNGAIGAIALPVDLIPRQASSPAIETLNVSQQSKNLGDLFRGVLGGITIPSDDKLRLSDF